MDAKRPRARYNGVKSLPRMKIALKYIVMPILFAFVLFIYSITARGTDFTSALSQFGLGVIFYSAPYIVFAVLHILLKLPQVMAHFGYAAATLALATVSAFWLLPPDQSGLPIQWMLYWPLSALLIVVFVGGSFAYRKLSNS